MFCRDRLTLSRTCLNLIVAFSKALKHRLRFEPYIEYDDMFGYVEFLNTYAKDANVGVNTTPKEPSKLKKLGEVLGISFSRENPRTALKKATKPLGNLPMEILVYLQTYFDSAIDQGQLKAPIFQMQTSTFTGEKLIPS
jgi:ion channel-forming bestrophin family protein